MAPYKGPERRRGILGFKEDFEEDVTGLLQRVIKEGVPIDEIQLREEDPKRRDLLIKTVRTRIARLFGLEINTGHWFPQKEAGLELSIEKDKLLKNLEKQYPKMRNILKYYWASLPEGMPSWEDVKQSLIIEILDKALKLQKPTLLLIPPVSREEKIKAIDTHKVKNQANSFVKDLKNNDLWNGGKEKIDDKWRAVIVEGGEPVATGVNLGIIKHTNYDVSKKLVRKFEEKGLDIMEGADSYLMLQMKVLYEGRKIDDQALRASFTVLNAKSLEENFPVAVGSLGRDISLVDSVYYVVLTAIPAYKSNNLHVRALIELNV